MNKKCFLFLAIFISTLNNALSQPATTMTLEGVSPDVLYVQEVSSSQNILTGTLIITRTDTSSAENYVVDLVPASNARQSWEYNYSEGFKQVSQAQIYTSTRNMSQSTYVAKTWGIEQNTTEKNFWIGTLEEGQAQEQITYYLKFQDYTRPYAPAGFYQLDLEFRLWNTYYDETQRPQSPPPNISPNIRPITLSVLNEAYVYVTFADTNGLPINRIALDETSEKTIDLKVLTKSNYWQYDVTVTSINGGTLNLNTGSSIEKIPYNLWIVDMRASYE